MITPVERLALLALVACLLIAAAVHILFKLRLTPSEKEKRRRAMINRIGRMSDAMLTDVASDTLFYLYSVNGVDYNASQDVSALRDRVPAEPSLLIGNITLKYAPRNPANSIVLCEEWSGLRVRTQGPGPSTVPVAPGLPPAPIPAAPLPAPVPLDTELKENEIG